MKHVFGIILLAFLFSCNNSKPTISNKWGDTCYVAYMPKNSDTSWAMAKAVDSLGKVWAYGDSIHSEGQYKIDTFWRFRIQDVVRDSLGKAVLDSLKQPKVQLVWVTLTEVQKQSIFIYVLPKRKKI